MSVLLENFHSPLARLLLQFFVIILATRLAGLLFRRIGQPAVIGEIAAGILLGPSLFDCVWRMLRVSSSPRSHSVSCN